MSDRGEQILLAISALDSGRTSWDSLWRELADVVHPRRNLVGTPQNQSHDSAPDRSKLAEAFDGTAMRANRTLANGQFARITPMGARWARLRPPSSIAHRPAAVRWYGQCGEILETAFRASNFYNRAHEHYLDRGAFGTAATEITAGKNNRGLHFRAYPIGTYSIAADAQDEVDTLTRTAWLTPLQIIEQWPDSTPESVRKKAADVQSRHRRLAVCRIIRPRYNRDPRKEDSRNKPFESIYVLKDEKVILAESGFDEFPIACSRWELWGDSPYGWAPAYLALPEATQANFLEEMLDVLAETSAFPRVLYPANLKGDVDYAALGLTCYDPASGHKPEEWLTNGRYDIGKDRSIDKRRAIEEAFFVPLFNAISQLDKDATATEVRALVTESRELFHPIFANLVREFLDPIIRRSFAILLRQGAFPTPPAVVLQDGELSRFIEEPQVEYTSTMALALEQSQLANFADCVNTLAPIAQTDPGVFDFLDSDQIGPAFFRYKGLPENFVRTPEAIAQIRQARAQAQQAAAAKEAAQAIGAMGGAREVRQIINA